MKQHKRKLALLAAAILACSAAGCAGTQDQSSAQSQSQLWVVDNSVDAVSYTHLTLPTTPYV